MYRDLSLQQLAVVQAQSHFVVTNTYRSRDRRGCETRIAVLASTPPIYFPPVASLKKCGSLSPIDLLLTLLTPLASVGKRRQRRRKRNNDRVLSHKIICESVNLLPAVNLYLYSSTALWFRKTSQRHKNNPDRTKTKITITYEIIGAYSHDIIAFVVNIRRSSRRRRLRETRDLSPLLRRDHENVHRDLYELRTYCTGLAGFAAVAVRRPFASEKVMVLHNTQLRSIRCWASVKTALSYGIKL
ncbi:hypothetical protein EVAR_54109_1 [Eumeta japonica]|uniref:Uncharacterized protein n=1 Tax=Eumeta variegata TaxID=151549 RepID=A0A4C1YW29_EUMVA|nr:hypothetical protein EVAR_54109_1 [Eumeta japonica]